MSLAGVSGYPSAQKLLAVSFQRARFVPSTLIATVLMGSFLPTGHIPSRKENFKCQAEATDTLHGLPGLSGFVAVLALRSRV